MVSEEQKQRYIARVHEELLRRGLTEQEIPVVIGKTGFMAVMEDYPEEQLHYDPCDAVDEILLTAATFPVRTENIDKNDEKRVQELIEGVKGSFALSGMQLDDEDIERGRAILRGEKTAEECIAEIKMQIGDVSF